VLGTISYFIRHFAGIVLLLGSYLICAAQSHDPNQPTPLGPGVNKGNIDNVGNGPNYYYFHAGPGHVDVHYAFHEMGVFGNPMRQVLIFDILDEKNQVISHDPIQSVGALEKFTQPVNLASPSKLVIRATSPDAIIRLGGYYEIEVVGAAKFDGKATGQNVKPVDTSLVHAGAPLTGPPVSLSPGQQTSLTGPPGSVTSGTPQTAIPRSNSPAMARTGHNSTVIAVQGPNNSLNFYWNNDGNSKWNPSVIAGPGTTYSAPAMARAGH